MNCQLCGAILSYNSGFCGNCGTPLTPQGVDYPGFSYTPARRLHVGKLLGNTFEIYKRHFGTMCLVGLVLFGIPLVFGICSSIVNNAAQRINVIEDASLYFMMQGISILLSIFQTLAQWYVMLGAIRRCLYIARGGTDFQSNMMFPPAMMFLKVCGLMLLVSCINGGIIMVTLLPAAAVFMIPYTTGMFNGNELSPELIALIAVGSVFLIIGVCVTIWVCIRLSLAQVFIAAQGAGIIDSMGYSWRVTSGNAWKLFWTIFVLAICSISGILLCCIGIILTIAMSYLGIALTYLQLTGQPNYLDQVAPFPSTY